jgi:hypothetical protein
MIKRLELLCAEAVVVEIVFEVQAGAMRGGS